MNHSDHVRLLQKGVGEPGGTWADLGSGTGAFTLALADLLKGGRIYSLDRDQRALQQQELLMQAEFPATDVIYQVGDFTRALQFPPLDGIVMANSLHFVRNKFEVLQKVRSYLRPGAHFLLVEYNVDRGNPWVPYPLSYATWQQTAEQTGFRETQMLERVPSRFLREIYSALSLR